MNLSEEISAIIDRALLFIKEIHEVEVVMFNVVQDVGSTPRCLSHLNSHI